MKVVAGAEDKALQFPREPTTIIAVDTVDHKQN